MFNLREQLIEFIESSNLEEINKNDLMEFAKQAGIKNLLCKTKRGLINEIRFEVADGANRSLHEPDYYRDSSDEELIRDMFCCIKSEITSYSVSQGLGYVGNSTRRKVNCMESLFVNVRAGKEVRLHDPKVCGEISFVDDAGKIFVIEEGCELQAPANSPFYKDVKPVYQVVKKEAGSNLLFLDDRVHWPKESLISSLMLMGCAKKYTKG